MNEEKAKKLKKLSTFSTNPQLAILDTLEEQNSHLEAIHELLEVIAGKEPAKFPEIPPHPEMHSMEKMEELLTKLVEKENEPISINVEIV